MACFSGPEIVNNGLVLHLDAANPKSYSGSGTVWSDLNKSYNGTLTNGPIFSSLDNGYFTFDGVNDYIQTQYDITNKIDVTFQTWVKIFSYPTSTSGDIIFDQTTGLVGCIFRINPNGTIQGAIYNSAGTAIGNVTPLTVTLNEWTFLSVSFQSNNVINYFMNDQNFFLNTTYNMDIIKADTVNKFRIGATVDGNSSYNNIHGSMSYVAVYEKSLSNTEVKQNFEAIRSRYDI